jgi:transposase-like protein
MAVVKELEDSDINFEAIRRKYGIRGSGTVQKWARKYGHGDLGRIIRVEKPNEVNERVEMKKRIKALEKALADAHIDLAIERACTRVACRRAGIEDVNEFKKKVVGK